MSGNVTSHVPSRGLVMIRCGSSVFETLYLFSTSLFVELLLLTPLLLFLDLPFLPDVVFERVCSFIVFSFCVILSSLPFLGVKSPGISVSIKEETVIYLKLHKTRDTVRKVGEKCSS